jgi:hypothetical protein
MGVVYHVRLRFPRPGRHLTRSQMAGEVMFERAATLTSHLTAMGCIASARIL